VTTLTVLQEKLAEAHGLAIAATRVMRTAERYLEDWVLRDVLDELRRDAGDVRARCLALERARWPELAEELLAQANTTSEHVGDLTASWFKAGTDPFRAWSFVVMVEAGEVAAWSALAGLAASADDERVCPPARSGLALQEHHLELALEGVARLVERTHPAAERFG
jgi:hypothetical protein